MSKFQIGQIVYNRVSRRGSYGPSIISQHSKLHVDAIKRVGDGFMYVCGYEGWEFKENELMTQSEYIQTVLKSG